MSTQHSAVPVAPNYPVHDPFKVDDIPSELIDQISSGNATELDVSAFDSFGDDHAERGRKDIRITSDYQPSDSDSTPEVGHEVTIQPSIPLQDSDCDLEVKVEAHNAVIEISDEDEEDQGVHFINSPNY